MKVYLCVCIVLCSVMLAICMKRILYASMVHVPQPLCAISIDDRLSDGIKVAISDYVKDCYAEHQSFERMQDDVKKRFPCIDTCSMQMKHSGHFEFKIMSKEPLCCVNTSVMSHTGLLCDQSDFHTEVLSELPHMSCDTDPSLLDVQRIVAGTLPESWSLFRFVYSNADTLLLYDRKDTTCCLLFSVDHVPQKKDLELYEYLKKNNSKKKKIKKIDFRFHNMVVTQ